MSNIIPFEFENHTVRVNLDADNEPWFNANDICKALEHGNARQALESHVDKDDVQKMDVIDSLGRNQRANHVNESGLYALILGSNLPKAKKFKRWVTHEVLPSIRKTGVYAAPASIPSLTQPTQDRVNALLMIGEAIAKVPGVRPGIAMAATLTCIHENTGLAIETLRRALPINNEPICSMNPTSLGEHLGLSARAVNRCLSVLGYQRRNERDEWELTEAGQAWGEALPYSRNGHSGYQILWNPAVLEQLKEVA